jgi:hypothetical protein
MSLIPARSAFVRRHPVLARVGLAVGAVGALALITSTVGPRASSAFSGDGRLSAGGQSGQAIDRPWERLGPEGWPQREEAGSPTTSQERGSGAQAMPSPKAPATDKQGNILLGSLVGAEFTLWVYSAQDGPVYTVVSAKGKVLAESLTMDEVYRSFPQMPLDKMVLSKPEGAGSGAGETKLMLADQP